MSAITGRTLGGFVVKDRIGEGTFAEVFLAEQELLEREAVVKVLRLRHRSNPRLVARFLREARLASRLDHPYAAHIYGFGAEPDGVLWIAMELVRGTTMAEQLEGGGPLPVARFLPLFERLCEVVGSAHEQGIIHRDIKPANVMVLARAGRLLPKLLDLGVARSLDEVDDGAAGTPPSGRPFGDTIDDVDDLDDERATPRDPSPHPHVRLSRAGRLVGTPAYLAPELWSGGTAGARSDQYALAVLAYEALVGRLPFAATTPAELGAAQRAGAMTPLPAGLPEPVEEVLARGLAFRPEDRFADVLALAAALRAATGLKEDAILVEIDPGLRDRYQSAAPQPLAEAVAGLAAAATMAEAVDAIADTVSALVRLVAAGALATHLHLGRPPSAAAAARLRRLPDGVLDEADALALAAELMGPLVESADACPIPALVTLAADRAGVLSALVSSPRTRATREGVAAAVARLLAALSAAAFLTEHPLVVPRGDRALFYGGLRRSRRSAIPISALSAPLEPGRPLLVAPDGRPVLALWPFVQVAEPTPGAAEELFFIAGGTRAGARLVALPLGFERHDDAVWSAIGAGLAHDVAPGPAAGAASPWLGLAAYGPEDADRFVGRETEVQGVLNLIRTHPLTAIVGPSGAGKSSLCFAGAVPRLSAERRILTCRPGPAPLAALTRAAGVLAAAELGEELRRTPTLLVVDQLEEVFTQCADPALRLDFAEQLGAAARAPDDRLRVLVTCRDDFLTRLAGLPPLAGLLTRSLLLCTTPQPGELVRILVEPAARLGYRFDDDALPEEMARQIADRPGALALLSFAAAALWERRDRRFQTLTRRAYESLGGVAGALARHAEAVLSAMTPRAQAICRRLFRHLATSEGTRVAVPHAELTKLAGDATVVERLLEARLLVGDEDEDGETRVEIIHETLLVAWPRLEEWRREDADDARLRDQLRQAAGQWDGGGRPAGLLWRGDALAEIERWRARQAEDLPAVWEAFVAAGRSEATRGRRVRTALVFAAFAVLLASGGMLAWQNRRVEAARRTAEAQVTWQLQEQGRQLALGGRLAEAWPMLRQAYQRGARDEGLRYLLARAGSARDAELLALPLPGPVRSVYLVAGGTRLVAADQTEGLRVWSMPAGRELARFAHPEVVFSDVTADGTRAVTAGRDGEVRLWDVARGTRIATLWVRPNAQTLARFSPDGTRLLIVSYIAQLWDAKTGARLAVLGHPGTIWTAAFDPAGRFVVTLDDDGRIAFFDWDGHTVGQARQKDWPIHASLSRDGTLLATAAVTGTVRVFRVPTGELVCEGKDHRGRALFVTFDTPGKRLVSAGEDGTARILGVPGCQLLHTMAGHVGRVNRARFFDGDTRIVTVGHDALVRIWDAETGQLRQLLSGHDAAVWYLAVDEDGHRLATGGDDFTVRVWDTTRDQLVGVLPGHEKRLRSVSFSPDGTRLLSAGQDGTARVWDWAARRTLATLPHADVIWFARYRPDGRQIATAGQNGEVRLWGPAGEPEGTLAHDRAVRSLAWSPDGARLATLRDGGRLTFWDVARRETLSTLDIGTDSRGLALDAGWTRFWTSAASEVQLWGVGEKTRLALLDAPRSRLNGVVLSPDGTLLASPDANQRVWLWDAADGTPRAILRGHAGWVTSVAFRADSELLASAALDGTARIWEARSGRLLGVLGAGSGWVDAIAFAPDGLHLATAGPGNDVYVWDVHGESRLPDALQR